MTSTQTKTPNLVWSRLWRAGLLAAGIAAVGNVLLYFVARALGAMPQTVVVPSPGGENPITAIPVIIMSIMPAVLATAIFALLVRFTSRPRPIFGVLATLVFIGMFFGPLNIPGAPVGMIVTLELMHGVAAAAIVGVLLGALRQPV